MVSLKPSFVQQARLHSCPLLFKYISTNSCNINHSRYPWRPPKALSRDSREASDDGQQNPQRPSRKQPSAAKEKLPRGFRRYETTAVLRPDVTEEERIAWTQRYDEAIIAGGAMSVEFSNRGMLSLMYSIKKKNKAGVATTYLEGVYMHISYVTKPQSQLDLQRMFNADDDIIRTVTVLLK